MVPLDRIKFYGAACLLFVGLQFTAVAETIQGSLGLEQTSVVSSIYTTKRSSKIQGEATYARQFSGRFSAFGQYQTKVDNTLSAGIGGVAFDSEDIQTKGGTIHSDGSSEVSRVPIWMFRSSVGVGLFKYVDILRSNNSLLGNKNEKPVQADLYGLKFATSLVKFMDEDWGVMASGSYVVASAQNFGLSSTCLSLGLIYKNN